MMTRSVSIVLSSTSPITCSYVIVSPGNFETPTHILGGSSRMTVDVVAGPPFTFALIFAPTTKFPSIFAESMTPLGHSDGFAQTAQTVDVGETPLSVPYTI